MLAFLPLASYSMASFAAISTATAISNAFSGGNVVSDSNLFWIFPSLNHTRICRARYHSSYLIDNEMIIPPALPKMFLHFLLHAAIDGETEISLRLHMVKVTILCPNFLQVLCKFLCLGLVYTSHFDRIKYNSSYK